MLRNVVWLLPVDADRGTRLCAGRLLSMASNVGNQNNSSRGSGLGSSNRRHHSSKATPGKDRIECLGRTLTKILRHMAVDLKLNLRSDGFCSVDELLKLNMKTLAGFPLSSHTTDDVLDAVGKDSKQRFSTAKYNGELYIRANQGHSIKQVRTEELLKEIKTPQEVDVCIHGTFKSKLESILKEGLKLMGRNHVHFATGLPKEDGVISGMKNMCDVLIYLDVAKALQDGMKIYISDNKVVLTEGFDGVIPPNYFKEVVDKKTGKVLWRPTPFTHTHY